MSQTSRGATLKGGSKAVTGPFMDGGTLQRVPISVDNTYNRGRIPAYSLWAPSDKSSNPWKYLPYIPCVNIEVANSTSSFDIPNAWVDYFRVGDELIVLDTSAAASGTLTFRGKSGENLSACALDTDSVDVTSVGAKDSGGAGYVLLGTEALNAVATGGVKGTGDVFVLAGTSTALAVKSYQEADNIVVMEQEFDFADAITGVTGEGGYLVESCVYSYPGRIDTNYLEWYLGLNTYTASPTFAACGIFTNYTRFNFESIYRG